MKKIITIILISLLVIGGVFAYQFYNKIYNDNVNQTTFIYIPTNAGFEDILDLIDPYLKNKKSFIWVAEKKNYPNKIRAGKFKISKGMNNEALVDHLRGGKAETINLTFNNQDSFEKLAGRVAKQIEADSISLLRAIKDEDYLKKNNFSSYTALAMYIPNSYEFYWNTSAEKFRKKMLEEYKKFWNK